MQNSSSWGDEAPAFNNGKNALVNINGEIVLTANVSAIWLAVTKFILVDRGETPALLTSRFKPPSVSWIHTKIKDV